MRRRFAFALAIACTAGCMTATHQRLAVEAPPEERSMLETLTASNGVGQEAVEAALIVGGARGQDLAQMEAALGRTLDAIVRDVGPLEPAGRGRSLLAALFAEHAGRTLLRQYEASATTLYDVVATGHFNCVSATALYLLAAARAGVDARPVLLPSHARAVVVAGGRSFVVETTTPNGFDPPASISQAARDRARPTTSAKHLDLYADERGTEVDWKALLAVTYGNLGIAAQDRGDTALAAALLAREAVLTPPTQAPIVRLQQMSLLSELATQRYAAGDFAGALAFARRAFDAAGAQAGKRLAEQNIAAIASRSLIEEAPHLSDGALASFAEPLRSYSSAYGDVQAVVLTLVAERKTKHGDIAGAAVALHEASGFASSDEMRAQAGQNAILGDLNRMSEQSTTDAEAAWVEWKRLVAPPDPRVNAAYERTGAVIAQNRSIRLSNDARCRELDAALAETPNVQHGPSLRASCRERHALAQAGKADFKGALADMRAAVSIEPLEPRHRENLVIMLEKETDRLIHSARCEEIPPLVAEGRALDPGNKFLTDAVEYCRSQ